MFIMRVHILVRRCLYIEKALEPIPPFSIPISILWNIMKQIMYSILKSYYDDVIKRKHFQRYWFFVWGIHWSPVNSPNKDQWHGVLMFSVIYAWTNGGINTRDASGLRRHRTRHSNVIRFHKDRLQWLPYLQFCFSDIISISRWNEILEDFKY